MRTVLVQFVTVLKAGRSGSIPKTLKLLLFLHTPGDPRDLTQDPSLAFEDASQLKQ